MDKKLESEPDMSQLRLRIAVNRFKRLLLKDLHVPGRPQTNAVAEEIGDDCGFTGRTWESWFADTPIVPKLKKVTVLDALAASKIRVPDFRGGPKQRLPARTFSELIHGGLVRRLLAPSTSKKSLPTLVARAIEYKPVSPLHLHLDAIEVDALAVDFGDVPWRLVKEIGAHKILEVLAARWNPRHGTVYSELSSDLSQSWTAANDEEREDIRKSCARFKPDLFKVLLNKEPRPNWTKAGIDADIPDLHIYKALFSLAADSDFLVSDRLAAWSLDLATSAFAMHALAWTDRYETFGPRVTDEMTFWSAFEPLLFESELPELDQVGLLPAMCLCKAEWDDAAERKLLDARENYHSQLQDVGVTAMQLHAIAMQGAKAHPLVYD